MKVIRAGHPPEPGIITKEGHWNYRPDPMQGRDGHYHFSMGDKKGQVSVLKTLSKSCSSQRAELDRQISTGPNGTTLEINC